MHKKFIDKYKLKDIEYDLEKSFKIHAVSSEISKHRKKLDSYISKYDINHSNLFLVAYDEIITNIAEHSYKYDKSKMIRIELKIKEKILYLEIQDNGPAYDITKKRAKSPKKQFDKGAEGGYGMYLLKRILYKIDYLSEENTNYIYLQFNAAKIKFPVFEP